LGLLCLMLGADISSDAMSSAGAFITLGLSGLMVYYSWKGMRYFKSRAFLYWLWGYAASLTVEIGMRFGYAAGPPLPGAIAHTGWFWNLVQNAGLSSLHAEWFLELYWLVQIVAGVLIAAGIILLARTPEPESGQAVPVNTAKYVALGVLLMLIGIYPSLRFFESPGFLPTCATNGVILAYAVSGFRRGKGVWFSLWAWASGVALLLAAGSQFHRTWEYPPRESDRIVMGLMVAGELVAGLLRLVGLMLALRQLPGNTSDDGSKTETAPKLAFFPRPSTGMKKRLAAIISIGGMVIGIFWLSQNDPSQVLSLEPKYEGHTLSYWLDHWHTYPDSGNGNPQARAAVQSIGSNAVPTLLKMIGHRSGDPMQALVSIGAEAAPALASKLVETLADTNPPMMNWRRSGFENSAWHVQECVVETLKQMGTNAAPALPALINAMMTSNWWTQAEAAGALASVGHNQPDTVIPVLINALTISETGGMSQWAICRALGDVGVRRPDLVIPVLINVLTNAGAEPRNQAAAAAALASVGKDQPGIVVPVLLGVFTNIATHPDHPPGAIAGFMYREHFYDEIPFFVYGNSIAGALAGIADALATFGSSAQTAVPFLVLAGKSTNADLRAHVAIAVQRISPESPDALSPLIRSLAERDAQVREQAL
jgi:HEAT repeat protein